MFDKTGARVTLRSHTIGSGFSFFRGGSALLIMFKACGRWAPGLRIKYKAFEDRRMRFYKRPRKWFHFFELSQSSPELWVAFTLAALGGHVCRLLIMLLVESEHMRASDGDGEVRAVETNQLLYTSGVWICLQMVRTPDGLGSRLHVHNMYTRVISAKEACAADGLSRHTITENEIEVVTPGRRLWPSAACISLEYTFLTRHGPSTLHTSLEYGDMVHADR